MKAAVIGGPDEQRLARPKDFPRRRPLEREEHLLLEKPLPLGEIQRVQTQLVGGRFEKREAGVLVVHHPFERGGDSLEQIVQVEVGDHGVGHFQQHAQAVALPAQLLLVGLGVLEIEGIVHGQRHLGGDAPEEFQIVQGIRSQPDASEAQHTHPAMGRGKGQSAKRFHSVLTHQTHDLREAVLLVDVVDDEWLLGLDDVGPRAFHPEASPFPLLRGAGSNSPVYAGA